MPLSLVDDIRIMLREELDARKLGTTDPVIQAYQDTVAKLEREKIALQKLFDMAERGREMAHQQNEETDEILGTVRRQRDVSEKHEEQLAIELSAANAKIKELKGGLVLKEAIIRNLSEKLEEAENKEQRLLSELAVARTEVSDIIFRANTLSEEKSRLEEDRSKITEMWTHERQEASRLAKEMKEMEFVEENLRKGIAERDDQIKEMYVHMS
jgi:chromosome segregation ATPase